MDLTSDDAIGAFGLLLGEAVDFLVDAHDIQMDKRAALMKVRDPTFSQADERLLFTFHVEGPRESPAETRLSIHLYTEADDRRGDPLGSVSFSTETQCGCQDFSRSGAYCPHTLAASWWLQEKSNRHGAGQILEFFSDLEVDEVAAGRELIDELLQLARSSHASRQARESAMNEAAGRLQWRIGFNQSRYYCPILIRAYEQRPKKNNKGWTKGKEVRPADLLRRDYVSAPRDGHIASLVFEPTYSFDETYFDEFRALELLIGHPNVAWDDERVTPIEVMPADLALTLRPIDTASDDEANQPGEPGKQGEPGEQPVESEFLPHLTVAGEPISTQRHEIVLGRTSPAAPVVVVFDRTKARLLFCRLRDARATRIIEYLLRGDLNDVRIDSETASRFSVESASIDSLVRVELPPQLAGPVEPVAAEMVIRMRPRPGAGLLAELAMHDDRFRDVMTPGMAPDTVSCLTEDGPVRLRRELGVEKASADATAARFELNRFPQESSYQYVLPSDESALDLLALLHEAGDAAPRIIWPEGESLRVRGEMTPSALRVQIDDGQDWFGLTGSIDVDGVNVPLADLLSAVRDNRALVQVGDREFAKISDSFRRRLQQLGDAVTVERGTMKIADAAVPTVEELLGDDVSTEAARRWHDSIARLEQLARWEPQQPAGLDATLRDYQLDGYRWLARLAAWGVGGVLADDMGLGKTVQTLGVLVDRATGGPALVVAPTSVGDNWVRESNRFAPELNPKLYRESDRKRLVKSAGPGDLIIVSYQLLQRDAENFASRDWHTLVLDEAQFIKNAQTKTSRAAGRLRADWRVALSGTPLENHLGELWSLLRTISPGLLGSWDRFRTRFADPIERLKDDDRRQSLAELVRPFILRRTKDKVLKELPPRTEITLQAELGKTERKHYEDARLAALAELSGVGGDPKVAGQQRIKTLAWLTKLRQLACHVKLVDATWQKSSAKMDLLMELVDELRDGEHRALVFSQFVKHLSLVRAALDERGIEYQYLDGGTPAAERQRRVDAFQNGEGELFLISLKAGGTGLNLTAADYVVHLDPWWNPAVEDQATDRAHRIGQERPVTVYRLVAAGTIEEKILQMHADKRELVSGVLDGTDTAGRLDTNELINLIRDGG